jgi:hypothetical protein
MRVHYFLSASHGHTQHTNARLPNTQMTLMRVHYFLSASHGHTLPCVLTHPLTQLNSTDLARVPRATSKTWISPSQCSLRPRSSADGCESQRKTSAWPPPQVRQGSRLQRGSCSEDACTPAPLCRRLSTLGTETCTVSQETLERCGQNSGQSWTTTSC